MACGVSLGTIIDWSASYKIMEVGFNLPKPNCSYTEYGKRFTLAPRSNTYITNTHTYTLKPTSIILQLVDQSLVVPMDIPYAVNYGLIIYV